MINSLSVLIVEDNAYEVDLIMLALSNAGFDPVVKVVRNESEFREHLHPKPAIILTDFSLYEFSAFSVLQILNELSLDIHSIIISSREEERRAVRMMYYGADDYILKDNLKRVASVVDRVLKIETCGKGLRRNEPSAVRTLSYVSPITVPSVFTDVALKSSSRWN